MATATKPLNNYYANLLESFNIVATAATKAHERATRLTVLAGSEITDAQRESIALAKDFATDKVEPAAVLPRYTEASAKVQNHVASYAKATLQETLDAAAEYRETAQKLFDTNKKLAEAFAEVVGDLANGQAFSDAIQAFNPAAPKVKAESK
jgi:hypothetical protein